MDLRSGLSRTALIVWPVLLLCCCSSDGNDTGNPPDGGDTDTGTAPDEWTIEQVENLSVGLQAKMVVGPQDDLAIAYWANEAYEDGLCDEVPVDPPVRLRQEIRFAEKTSSSQEWSTELVIAPVVIFGPTGLSLAYDPDGHPAVAFTGGDPQMQFCGSNDAVLGVRESQEWTFETAAAESGESATGDPASDAGFVVGFWPALAYDSQGEPAIVHKDVHFGALQSDDFRRADAEFAWSTGSSWTHEAIDYGDGAGGYNALVFDQEGRPVAFYLIPLDSNIVSRHGVWAARRENDGTWNTVKLHSGSIHQEISAGIDPNTGAIVTAFYSAKNYAVRVRQLDDPDSFTDTTAWTSELVCSPQYDEGRHVSLAFTPSGRLALSFHRCRLLSSGSESCDHNDEAVVFAIKDGNEWAIQTAAKGGLGSCGEFSSLVFDSSGSAHIAYRCTVETDDGYSFRLFVASKNIQGAL